MWQVHTSKSTGKTYYSNRVTKKTTWTKPHDSLIFAGSAIGVAAAVGSSGAQSGAVVDGPRRVWLTHTSKTTGKTYFSNIDTGTTTWVKPDATIIVIERERGAGANAGTSDAASAAAAARAVAAAAR